MKTLGQFLEEAKATYCGRCGTRHVPPSKGGTCPALKEGSMPTTDEPTEHDKKMAQKVRDLLAKEKKPKKMDEAVEVSHDRYRSSHGKKASGAGAWMFTHKRSGEATGDDTFTAPVSARSFTDAAKHAKAWAKSKGHRTVYVMENTIQEADKGIRMARVMHKGQHVANVITYRGRGGNWVSGAETPDGQNATKKYGIGLIDTKKEILKKIKQYHKENN